MFAVNFGITTHVRYASLHWSIVFTNVKWRAYCRFVRQRSTAVVRTVLPKYHHWSTRTSVVVIRRGTTGTCAGVSVTRRSVTATRWRRWPAAPTTSRHPATCSPRRPCRPTADREPTRCPSRRRPTNMSAHARQSLPTTPRPDSINRGIRNRYTRVHRICGTQTTNLLVCITVS